MSVQRGMQLNAASKIDVLIPAIEKDLATLPLVIDNIRRYVKHPIGSIYIVSPVSAKIKKLCSRKNCIFVNERSVLPITKTRYTTSPPVGIAQAGYISSCSK
ncbi:hypothetical protein HNR77_005533 [Paenibacillus sp. JGP012]|nr:hypothetical protein [Paenibacillus sp. JGP012]